MNFVDSNIILYSLLAEQAPVKHAIAIALLKSGDIILSTQVVGEVSAVLTRKSSLSNDDVRRIADDLFIRYPVFTVEKADMLEALSIRSSYQLSYWDSLIVAVALRAGAEILYSEDTHDGLVIRGRLTIRNPFK
ncbi:MAG TPA: PIN domain-containing protein [Candidatus Kapabacteria bacterium]|nr:PIN domain-containing protein [Candidatus Kapabacteria bacterium]